MDEQPNVDSLTAAFKSAYPTYKEARLFVLHGGDCLAKQHLTESTDPNGYRYTKFQAAALNDYVTNGMIYFTFGSTTLAVDYPSSSEGQGLDE